jgi:hypothetical protein
MTPNNQTQAGLTTSKTTVSVTLRADGKNWKDWIKQLTNYAAAEGAFRVLDGAACPTFDDGDTKYDQVDLLTPALNAGMSQHQVRAAWSTAEDTNKLLRPYNEDVRRRKEDDRRAHEQWVSRDARLQNTILSSIALSLVPQVRNCSTANDMYKVLKELNNSTDYANAAAAWTAFIDLRADSCKSVREYIGKLRENINDLAVQGIHITWKKPQTTGVSVTDSTSELMVIHMLHGLEKVIPEWVEDRNNDLRQGSTWTIDALISSVEDHIRNAAEEPVKTFTTISKEKEEKRVLQRLSNQTTNDNTSQSTAPTATATLPTRPATPQTTPWTPRPPKTLCTHCNKEHVGGLAGCWKLYPHLMPDSIRQQRAANAKANVSLTDNAADSNYTSIFTTISPTIIQKAVKNADYRKRYCYDTAANRHVFNDLSKFVTYAPIQNNNVKGSTGSTAAVGEGIVRLHVVKSDGTTHDIHLAHVLHCPDFATNVISQAPFKHKGAWYHSGKDKLYNSTDKELAYLPEMDGVPNFLAVTDPSEAPAALSFASLHAYRTSPPYNPTRNGRAKRARRKTPTKRPSAQSPPQSLPSHPRIGRFKPLLERLSMAEQPAPGGEDEDPGLPQAGNPDDFDGFKEPQVNALVPTHTLHRALARAEPVSTSAAPPSTTAQPLQLYTDNQSALNMVRKDGHHERTKHIDNYYRYTKQEYQEGRINLEHVPGINMPADGLTKHLERLEHVKLIKLINMVKVPNV